MAPLVKELSSLEVEPLEIVVSTRREGFYTVWSQDSRLDTFTTTVPGDVDGDALLTDKSFFPINEESKCCCCCCPACCC